MEIADVFVVNKADRPGTDQTVSDLQGMLELSGHRPWTPPIVRTVATTGDGVGELFDAVVAHRAHLESSGEGAARRNARLREELRALVAARTAEAAAARCTGPAFDALVADVADRKRDPYSAADELMPD
jgi:LAO/AO transport system kinase